MRSSIEIQFGWKAGEELGNSVRGLVLEADGTINIYLHDNANTARMRKRFKDASRIVQSIRTGDRGELFRSEMRRAMAELCKFVSKTASVRGLNRGRTVTPGAQPNEALADATYMRVTVTGRQLIKAGMEHLVGALVDYDVLSPDLEYLDAARATSIADRLKLVDGRFAIDLKRLLRIFHRLELLDTPDRKQRPLDAMGQWWYDPNPRPDGMNRMSDSGPLDEFFELGGISIKDVLEDIDGDDPKRD